MNSNEKPLYLYILTVPTPVKTQKSIFVFAHSCSIDDGRITFFINGEITNAYAPNYWCTVKKIGQT